jgi:serine/threonine protein kinase
MMLAIGQLVQNRYRLDGLLGRGGMGAVYRAYDTNLNRPCALKILAPPPGIGPAEVAQLRRQFQHEASVLANLTHPSLPRVTDYFTWSGDEFLVMDFVEGESLETLIQRQGAVAEVRVLAWADQLLDALAYCHSRNILHRDVKPANIIITPQGRAVLVDFGLVKLWNPGDPRTMTVMRGLGTPAYAPPEQYSWGPGHTDARSDLYSLGATLYHALAGVVPPTATDRMAHPTVFAPLHSLRPGISPHVEAAIARAMELPVDQRFASAAAMRKALTSPAKALAPAHRKPVGLWLAAGAAVVIVAALAVLLSGQSPDPATPTQTSTSLAAVSPASTWTVAPAPTPTPRPTMPASPVVAASTAPEPKGRIVFHAKRGGDYEIYTILPDGSDAVNLTRNPAQDRNPGWSPDRRWIVFDSDRTGRRSLWLMRADGSDLHQITSGKGTDYAPDWSPDGSRIVFVSTRSGDKDLYIVNADGSGLIRLTSHDGSEAWPEWSPDGRWIAFNADWSGNHDLYRLPATGGDAVRLTSGRGDDSAPAWSPDGAQIAFDSDRNGQYDVWLMNADGSGLTCLVDHAATDGFPAWSPDGQWLAFDSNRDGGGENWELYLIRADGSGLRRLTNTSGENWYPDW